MIIPALILLKKIKAMILLHSIKNRSLNVKPARFERLHNIIRSMSKRLPLSL